MNVVILELIIVQER